MGLLKIGTVSSNKEKFYKLITLFFSGGESRLEVSGGESRLEDTKRDFLGKLRSMTGGQVVAVTVDKVYKKKSQPEKEKLMDKLKQVSGSSFLLLYYMTFSIP